MFWLNDVPCNLTAEAYYKFLYNLMPYTQENVSVAYYPQSKAQGSIWGFDVKLNAELTQDVESWLSLSLMHAQQDIAGDALGSLPMPADQRFNA
jgi:hypothetical protein